VVDKEKEKEKEEDGRSGGVGEGGEDIRRS
jgi:hypothetical protein